jgi:hypothetical protein
LVFLSRLIALTKKSSMGKFRDLTGRVFDHLTVIKYAGRNKQGRHLWLCRCDCRNKTEILVLGSNLRPAGHTTSCGCKKLERLRARVLTHGHTRGRKLTPEYRCWINLRTRCLNSNSQDWIRYGGRGIKVCDRWQGEKGFSRFYQDMGEKPEPKRHYSIDRVDPDGDYTPDNCRWATKSVQNHNKRKTQKPSTSQYRGVHRENGKFRARLVINKTSIRCGLFDSEIAAAAAFNRAARQHYRQYAYLNQIADRDTVSEFAPAQQPLQVSEIAATV